MSTLSAPTPLRRPTARGLASRAGLPLKTAGPALTLRAVGQAFTAFPFDALRFQYANAVKAGLVQRSLLASAKSERAIDLLEKLVLGPIARQR